MQAIRGRADAIGARQGQMRAPSARSALAGPSSRAQMASKAAARRSDSSAISSSSHIPSSERRDEHQQQQQQPALEICNQPSSSSSSRRQALLSAAAVAAAGVVASSSPRPARALETAVDAAANAPTTTTPTTTTTTPSVDLEPFLDNDWSISFPRGYTYREDLSAPPPRDPSRAGGPAPPRSPLRARFDAPPLPGTASPAALLSVIVRQAQTLRPTLVQVGDISAFGTPEEAASLLLPRGARLVAASQATEALPARETPLGTVPIPPVSYYYYEFVARGGDERAVLAAAASRGKVYVAGGSAPLGGGGGAGGGGWEAEGAALAAAVRTFRLRNQVALALEQQQQLDQRKKKG